MTVLCFIFINKIYFCIWEPIIFDFHILYLKAETILRNQIFFSQFSFRGSTVPLFIYVSRKICFILKHSMNCSFFLSTYLLFIYGNFTDDWLNYCIRIVHWSGVLKKIEQWNKLVFPPIYGHNYQSTMTDSVICQESYNKMNTAPSNQSPYPLIPRNCQFKVVLNFFFCDFFQSLLYILTILLKHKTCPLKMNVILSTEKVIWKQVLWKRGELMLSDIKKKFKFSYNLTTQR